MNMRRTSAALLLLGCLVGATVVAACAKNPETMPVADPSGPAVGSGGEFVWHELLTDDLAASSEFYAQLLGWEYERTNRLGKPYLLAHVGDRYVGGMVEVDRAAADEKISQWVSYMRVSDIDRAVAAVTQAGGRALVGPVDIGGAARAALVVDSQRAPLGLLQTSQDLNAVLGDMIPVGGFLWRDYLADDVEQALGFYSRFAGYEQDLEDRADALPHYVLMRGRGGAGLVPIEGTNVEPHWLPYVRVDDAADLASRAESLGGEVLLSPSTEVREGTLAIVADPTGAALALQKWPL